MPELETFIQNKDIQEKLGVSSTTATKIIKKIKENYFLTEDVLPFKNRIPLSCFEDYFKKRSASAWSKLNNASCKQEKPSIEE